VSDSVIITFALIAAVTGIVYGLYLAMWVFKLDAGNQKMQGGADPAEANCPKS
jgi:K(+)-stimulated pyrophosphate-energized sodium pump